MPPAQDIVLQAVRAVFDGSSAATSFLPAVQIKDTNGTVMAQTIGTAVLSGGSADVSFFPRVRRPTTNPVTLTYYQVIAALASTNTLVAEWHLTEGASPYADTSGNMVGGNGELLVQVVGTPMTQNNPAGPLTASPAGPSVKFNYDGTNPPALGEYLHTSLAPPSRFQFAGNLPYSVVAWVKPVSGTNTHPGGVVGNVLSVNQGMPTETDDGWLIAVKPSSLECTVNRYPHVVVGGSPDSVSLGAMSTTEWTMVAMTYDGTNLRGYANGTLVGTIASAGTITNGADAYVGLTQAGPPSIASWLYGAASEITVWASTLTTDELALLYLSGTA